MEFNKIASNMIFLGCAIQELNVSNDLISMTDNVKKGFNMDIDVEQLEGQEEKARLGKVVLDITIELSKNEEKKGDIHLKMEGAFEVNDSVDVDEFHKMLLLNGATTLYSIARGKIESITASIYQNGKITLPMINMYEFYKEKAKER